MRLFLVTTGLLPACCSLFHTLKLPLRHSYRLAFCSAGTGGRELLGGLSELL